MDTVGQEDVTWAGVQSTTMMRKVVWRQCVQQFRVYLLDVKHCLWRVRRPGQELCHIHRTAAVMWQVAGKLKYFSSNLTCWDVIQIIFPNMEHNDWRTASRHRLQRVADVGRITTSGTSTQPRPQCRTWPGCLTVACWQCSETEWHTHVTVLHTCVPVASRLPDHPQPVPAYCAPSSADTKTHITFIKWLLWYITFSRMGEYFHIATLFIWMIVLQWPYWCSWLPPGLDGRVCRHFYVTQKLGCFLLSFNGIVGRSQEWSYVFHWSVAFFQNWKYCLVFSSWHTWLTEYINCAFYIGFLTNTHFYLGVVYMLWWLRHFYAYTKTTRCYHDRNTSIYCYLIAVCSFPISLASLKLSSIRWNNEYRELL